MKNKTIDRPGVVVYRRRWLNDSETFIVNQLTSLSEWVPVPMALVHQDNQIGAPLAQRWQVPDLGSWQRFFMDLFLIDPTYTTSAAFIRKHNIKLVHAHFGYDAFSVLPFVHSAKLPLIVTFHGYDVSSNLSGWSLEAVCNRLMLRRVFQHATLLVAVSDAIAGQLKRLGAPPSKIRTHYTGIPVEPKRDLSEERFGVVFVGRFVEKKGLSTLLRAYALISDEVRDLHPLIIIGAGSLESDLRKEAEDLGVQPQWMGWLGPTKIEQVLQRSAILCCPSQTGRNGDMEGLPTVILEALTRGLPVVATRHSGAPEAVFEGINGLLVNEREPISLSYALEKLLRDKLLRLQMGDSGVQIAREQFDVVKQTALLERLYWHVVANT